MTAARPLTPPPRRRRELVAWLAHEQPGRPADSWVLFCLGPCPKCHAAAVAATHPDGDGHRLLRGPIAERILDRTAPKTTTRPRRRNP